MKRPPTKTSIEPSYLWSAAPSRYPKLMPKLIFKLTCIILLSGCSEDIKQTSEPEVQTVTITKPRQIIVISDQTPDPYTHPSTHPSSLHENLKLDENVGHGDGGADVVFSGKVVYISSSGELKPVPEARFYRTNDTMLLGKKIKKQYDQTTTAEGDFAISAHIFAAYGCLQGSFEWSEENPFERGRHNPKKIDEYWSKAREEGEWVMYQTGTANLLVEAEGFEPRQFKVRYEQPSTMIVLNKKDETP